MKNNKILNTSLINLCIANTKSFKEDCCILLAKFAQQLPLNHYVRHSGVIDYDDIVVNILSSYQQDKNWQIKVNVFFQEILSGCACSDDPSVAMVFEPAYAEFNIIIDTNKQQVKIAF